MNTLSIFDTDNRFRDKLSVLWILALLGISVLSASYLSILHTAVDITGDVELFVLVVAGAVVGGILIGRIMFPWMAYLCAVIIAIGGVALYVPTIPEGYSLIISADVFWTDFVALFTGMSILRIINAGVWATAVAPVPVFLTSYFASRRAYSRATIVGCVALGFFVLTGDVDVTTGLIGILGAVAAIGFGDLDRSGGDISSANTLAIVLAVIVVLTVSVSVVPGGDSQPVLGARDNVNDAQTVESSLTNADNRLTIQGSTSLSPAVRFTVKSDQRAYWRVGAYNRYTGSGWIRTADSHSYNGSLSQPPEPRQTVRQTVRAEGTMNVMPAAWKPVSVENYDARVTGFEGLQPDTPLDSGDSYTVTSSVPAVSPEALRSDSASNETDYPDTIVRRYTRNPSSTPKRIEQYTDRLTSKANNSYDTARIIEQHLQQTKNYSLDVQRPNDHIADSFLFEMNSGYCTYFATTMAAMLRTQDIPARFVVGYTPGQQVDSNKWTVRGLNSHAWVEVYFPEHGWIKFDPTPSSARQQAEQSVIETAREEGVDSVDTNETTPSPMPEENESTENADSETPDAQTPVNQSERNERTQPSAPTGFTPERDSGGTGPNGGNEGTDGFQFTVPSRDQLLLGSVVLLGVVAMVRRSGVSRRAYREVWLRRQPRTDPESDIECAFERLEYLLAREHRPRRSGETRKQYVRAVGDAPAQRVGEIYEQAVYAGEATESRADEAVNLVDRRVRERSLL